MDDWLAVTVETSTEAVDAVANFLMEAGAAGIQIDDAADYQKETLTATGEWFDPTAIAHREAGAAVIGYFDPQTNWPELRTGLQQAVGSLAGFGLDPGPGTVKVDAVQEADWATVWQQYYHPVRVTRFVTIVPKWERYTKKQPDERVITLDPGLAFGTGTHPTTQLVLTLLEQTVRGGETMIDVGTGSGILALAATQLGVASVLATDIDAVAVANAQANLALNPPANIAVAAHDLLTDVDFEADLITANILATVLLPLIPQLPGHLKAGGQCLLSGIFYDQFDGVQKALAQAGMVVTSYQRLGDWYGLSAAVTPT